MLMNDFGGGAVSEEELASALWDKAAVDETKSPEPEKDEADGRIWI